MNPVNLKPDYGTFCKKEYGDNYSTTFYPFQITFIARLDKNIFSVMEIMATEPEFAISFDFDLGKMQELYALANINQKKIMTVLLNDIFTEPITIDLSHDRLFVNVNSHLDELVVSQYESFIPFIVDGFTCAEEANNNHLPIPTVISHVIFSKNEPVGFAIEKKINKKELNENTIDAYVCFPSMPENCEYGSIYCFKDLKEAQQSLAWQLKGSLAYAQSLNNLVSQDYQKARSLYEEYQNEFKKGFGNHGLILK